MNVGSYQQLVDSKGRIILPGAFRQSFSKSFIISAGFDRCLFLWKKEEFGSFVERELSRTALSPDARKLSRWFHSNAHEVARDSQFRFLVPPPLRDYAQLNREIILVGAGNRVEVWNRTEWQRYMEEASPSIEKVAESLAREYPI